MNATCTWWVTYITLGKFEKCSKVNLMAYLIICLYIFSSQYQLPFCYIVWKYPSCNNSTLQTTTFLLAICHGLSSILLHHETEYMSFYVPGIFIDWLLIMHVDLYYCIPMMCHKAPRSDTSMLVNLLLHTARYMGEDTWYTLFFGMSWKIKVNQAHNM